MDIARPRGVFDIALLRRFPNNGKSQYHRMPTQPGADHKVMQVPGRALKGRKTGGPHRGADLPGYHIGYIKIGDALTNRQTGRIKGSNQGMEKKKLLHQKGTPQTHRETSACHEGGYSRTNISAEMIDTAMSVKCLNHHIKLTSEFHSDLAWWECFLPHWNCRSFMSMHKTQWDPQVVFSSDASGTWGCGAIWSTQCSVLPKNNSRHDGRAWFGRGLWSHQSFWSLSLSTSKKNLF